MNFTIKVLTRDFVQQNIDEFIRIAKENIADEYWGKSHFLAELNNKWIYSQAVISKERKVIGFLIASEKDEAIHIHKFIVDASVQRAGVGTSMLRFLIGKRTAKPIMLKVHIENKKAIAFYERKGFKIKAIQGDLNVMKYDLA